MLKLQVVPPNVLVYNGGVLMQGSTLYQTLKIVSNAVLLLGATAIVYAAYISVKYWSGIGV